MNVKLQLAASYCVSNLTGLDEPGSSERHRKLKSMGVNRILQQLLNSNDQTLRDLYVVTTAYMSSLFVSLSRCLLSRHITELA